MLLRSKGRELDLSRPQVMGILNVTPDSFSDGNSYRQKDAALRHAARLCAEGATLLDIGGESTRPGAAEVAVQEELERVLPVAEAVLAELDVMVSVDTSKPEVIRAACRAGIHLVNDIRALRLPGALEATAADPEVLVCLMHMQGDPQTMQIAPHYGDMLAEVYDFLLARIQACEAAGIQRGRLLLDPGYGFGKTLEQNYRLLGQQARFLELGCPLLVGMSRKSMIGNLLDRPVNERLAGSLAAALFAAQAGARIIRVHDVKETCDALRVFDYAQECSKQ
ncbi:dihydropteroate synthase [Pseudaeromonas paramecii]|uniref:dihydropteroate synthase n=1 Tax=Pseudaeromonas paramecii TaxID=2138166 RepID=A0ABP8Q448_9GAMM